jgi:hypothetical protein
MNTCIYTNRGEEVPLGVECALPYLEPLARVILQGPDSGEHEGTCPLVSLPNAHSTPSPNGDGIARTNPNLYLVKGDHHAATFERFDSVPS